MQKQTIQTVLPVDSFFKVLPSLQVMGHTIAIVDMRTDKDMRYYMAKLGERVAWQGFVVSDYLKEVYKIESSNMISSSGYSDSYGKDIASDIEKALSHVRDYIKRYEEACKNPAKKGAGGGIHYLPSLITISNFGWSIQGIKPVVS